VHRVIENFAKSLESAEVIQSDALGRACVNPYNNNNNNNNITIYKAHNVRKKLNLSRRAD